MKLFYCIIFLFLFLCFYSCVTYFNPNSIIKRSVFSLISPNEEDWSFGKEFTSVEKDYELKTGERIWLERGWAGGIWQSPNYPIKNILIIRDSIIDNFDSEEMVRTRLNEIVKVEVKDIVDSLLNLPSNVENFHYLPSDDNTSDYLQYAYNNRYGFEYDRENSVIGQYYIYLPKYFEEYKSYYLFIYQEFPSDSLENELNGIIEKFKCIEDSVRY